MLWLPSQCMHGPLCPAFAASCTSPKISSMLSDTKDTSRFCRTTDLSMPCASHRQKPRDAQKLTFIVIINMCIDLFAKLGYRFHGFDCQAISISHVCFSAFWTLNCFPQASLYFAMPMMFLSGPHLILPVFGLWACMPFFVALIWIIINPFGFHFYCLLPAHVSAQTPLPWRII